MLKKAKKWIKGKTKPTLLASAAFRLHRPKPRIPGHEDCDFGPRPGVPSQGQSSQARFKPEQASTGLGGSASLPSLSSNCNDFLKVGKELHPVQDEDRKEVVAPESETAIQVKGPPKKMVSINDRAEVVIYERKKKKKTTDKSPSLEREKDEDTKPLKSILKAGSNLK